MHDETQHRAPIGYLVHEVARLFRRRFEDEARIHGVTLPQWRALAEIHRQEGISQVSLAGCIDTDPMTLSGILDRLEKRGLVAMQPGEDQREATLNLTAAGHAMIDRGTPLWQKTQSSVRNKLGADGVAQLEALLGAL